MRRRYCEESEIVLKSFLSAWEIEEGICNQERGQSYEHEKICLIIKFSS